MKPATLLDLLAYLQNLGQRHQDVKTSLVALSEQFKGLDAESYPLVLVEPDPFIEGFKEGAELYRVAFWVMTRAARTDSKADPELVNEAKMLADEMLQACLREQKITPQGQPTYTVHYGTADAGLASGVRCEQAFVLPNAVNRTTNPSKFTPLS